MYFSFVFVILVFQVKLIPWQLADFFLDFIFYIICNKIVLVNDNNPDCYPSAHVLTCDLQIDFVVS